jgi:hypothetical protein
LSGFADGKLAMTFCTETLNVIAQNLAIGFSEQKMAIR